MTVGIFVRKADGSGGEELDDHGKLDLVPRFNEVSSWSIELPNSSKVEEFIQPQAGIVVERTDTPTFTGLVDTVERSWADSDRWIVSGYSDDILLYNRLAYPSLPFNEGDGTFTFPTAYDVRTDQAETLMREFVGANAVTGGTFASGRAIPGLTLAADEGRGIEATYSVRFQTLGELCQTICLADGSLGFRIRELVFEIYEPEDLSADVVFSPSMGNLKSFKYKRSRPQANLFVIGGSGEGTARIFTIGGDEDSQDLWGRIEMFRDRRDTDDPVELAQTEQEEIADKGEQRGFSVTPIDLPSLSYGTDYNLGDLVTVEIGGVPVVDRLRQIHLTYDENGESIAPEVNTPTAQASAQALVFFDTVRRLSRRTSALEKAL